MHMRRMHLFKTGARSFVQASEQDLLVAYLVIDICAKR